jgi:hypothetical protein
VDAEARHQAQWEGIVEAYFPNQRRAMRWTINAAGRYIGPARR